MVAVGAVKIYVAAVEAIREKERQGKLTVSCVSPLPPPRLNANVLFCRFFKNLTLCMTKLRVPVLSFPDFTAISKFS